jgi:putative peptidoglycan lipid II flippase
VRNDSHSNAPGLAGQIGRAGFVIIAWTIADKILALGKEILTAKRFGVSAPLDVFNLTYAFPGILVLVFSGALSAAFVPLYPEWRNLSPEKADSHTTWLMVILSTVFSVITIACFLFAPAIIRYVGYGFPPDQQQSAVVMLRFLSFLILIDGSAIILTGILHAKKQFFHLMSAPIFVNIILILFLLLDIGVGVYCLIWGFLTGSLVKIIYLAFVVRRHGFRYGTPFPFDKPKMASYWWMALPLLGSQLIANSNLFIDQMMATQLASGSVSTLRYAFRINDLPIQVVIAALSKAIFPYISEEATNGNRQNLQDIFTYSLIFLAFLTIPLTCLMILFSEDLVTYLLKRGAFDLEAVRQTSQTLICFSIGLFFHAYVVINGTFFAALQQPRVLFYMGGVTIFLNVVFNWVFMNWLGVMGIALSTSLTLGTISIWFIIILKKRLYITNLGRVFSNFFRMTAAAAGMMLCGWATLSGLSSLEFPRLVIVIISLGLSSGVYLGLIWITRTAELTTCINAISGFIRRKLA